MLVFMNERKRRHTLNYSTPRTQPAWVSGEVSKVSTEPPRAWQGKKKIHIKRNKNKNPEVNQVITDSVLLNADFQDDDHSDDDNDWWEGGEPLQCNKHYSKCVTHTPFHPCSNPLIWVPSLYLTLQTTKPRHIVNYLASWGDVEAGFTRRVPDSEPLFLSTLLSPGREASTSFL